MPKKFEILDHEKAYRGFLSLERYRLRHESFHGGWCPPVIREQISGLGAASVLPYDPVRDELVFIEEFRTGAMSDPVGPWLLEVVSGYREPNETPEQVIHREAQEEAGLSLGRIEAIGGFYVSPGISTERIELFCACVDSRTAGGIHGVPEEGEETRVLVMSAQQAIDELFRRINSTGPIILMQWFAANRSRLQTEWLSDPV